MPSSLGLVWFSRVVIFTFTCLHLSLHDFDQAVKRTMSSLSYWQRCQHLYSILDDHVPNPGPSAFSVSASARRASVASDFRATQLDQLLATAWSAPSSKGKEVARILDVLRQVDRLRITTADFDLIGRVGQGQFGIVGSASVMPAEIRWTLFAASWMGRCTP
jgi:hypothetical protein